MTDFKHGRGGYVHHRCRCEVCAEANRVASRVTYRRINARARERREAAQAAGLTYVAPEQVTHGRRGTYLVYGCRCEPCKEAARNYKRATRDGSTS